MFLPVVVTTVIKFLNKNVWKCLREGKVVDIGLKKLDTLPQVIVEVVDVGQV